MANKIYNHGELIIAEVCEIPEAAKKLELKEDFKLADSETTGNHHMLAAIPGVELFQYDESYYVKTREDTKVYCKLPNRHTDLKLLKDRTYIIVPAQEFDHIAKHKRKVLD